ncbi:MAG: transposase [Chloroflexi bacterium]|nr:transposase [Chloroflexota bacterium]
MTTFFRRNLPHYHLPNAAYFITFRLAGSLPFEAAQRLREEYEAEERRLKRELSGKALYEARYQAQKRYFARVDKVLDQALYGRRWLAQPECAKIVMEMLHSFHDQEYHLHAFCLMSNHVHLLIDQQDIPEPTPRHDGKSYTALSRAMRLLKRRSAALCNQSLERSGPFWQHESYDHVVRNEGEFERILAYIANNPVKAGLVEHWFDCPYTYVNS